MSEQGAEQGAHRVAVTGLGVLSNVGVNVEDVAEALLGPDAKAPGFALADRWPLELEVRVGMIAQEDWPESPQSPYVSPTGTLCLEAARQATAQAAASGAQGAQALVVGTSTGGQSCSEGGMSRLLQGEALAFSLTAQGAIASVSRLIAQELGIAGEVSTISTACTSSANAIALGASWIRTGRYERVLVGGGDALCATTLCSFFTLGLTGARSCRPFGEKRPGMTLGEGAAFLMLESRTSLQQAGRSWLAELCGIGMSSDAYHMTSPHPEAKGAILAMRQALDDAGVTPAQIDYVNAHGTGTANNDAIESKAIQAVCGETWTSSVKGATGHTLAGSGALEAVLSIEALRRGRAPANFGASQAGEDCPLRLVGPDGLALPADAMILSNSFAFGGNNCTLLFGPPGRV